jgi:hypothetical protein
MTDDLDLFKKYYRLADEVIAKATKEELAECARLLALNVAHYRQKYGELPIEEQSEFLNTNEVDGETEELLAEGMRQLLSSLAMILSEREASEEVEVVEKKIH